jgi:predicted membrane-bound spermidine synthase
MERVKITEHKGKKIVRVDLSNLKIEEIPPIISSFTDFAISSKINLIAMDISNTFQDDRIKKASVDSMDKLRKAFGGFYTAIVGFTTMQKYLATSYSHDLYHASSWEDAFEWLSKKA